jgi:hypothetical protein
MARSKSMKKSEKQDRRTVMIRDVAWDQWQTFRESAEEKRMKLKYALEEALSEWIEKHCR